MLYSLFTSKIHLDNIYTYFHHPLENVNSFEQLYVQVLWFLIILTSKHRFKHTLTILEHQQQKTSKWSFVCVTCIIILNISYVLNCMYCSFEFSHLCYNLTFVPFVSFIIFNIWEVLTSWAESHLSPPSSHLASFGALQFSLGRTRPPKSAIARSINDSSSGKLGSWSYGPTVGALNAESPKELFPKFQKIIWSRNICFSHRFAPYFTWVTISNGSRILPCPPGP